MKSFYFLILITVALSCTKKPQLCTLKVTFECIPVEYFDSLSHILITDNYAVIDKIDNRSTLEKLFNKSHYVYKKDIPKSLDNYFYLDSVPKRKYLFFYVDAKLDGADYYGEMKDVDLTKEVGDTIKKTICIKPIVTMIPN